MVSSRFKTSVICCFFVFPTGSLNADFAGSSKTLSETVLSDIRLSKSVSSKSMVEEIDRIIGSATEKYVSETFVGLDVSIEGIVDGDPIIGMSGLKVLDETDDLSKTTFVQGSIYSQDGRHTFNAGLGHRLVSENKKWMWGVNVFYDHEFPYDHQRVSLGTEFVTSIAEFNANRYLGLSDWRTGKGGYAEKALDGEDFEIGLAIPYMPQSKVYHKEFRWVGVSGRQDLEGYTTSVKIAGDLFIKGLSVELGQTSFKNNKESIDHVKVTYSQQKAEEPSRPLFSSMAFQFDSVEKQRTRKVRRENLIVKQTRTKVIFRGE